MKIFQTLIDKYKAYKQKSLNKREFKEALLGAVSDGKITKEEIDGLDKKKKELGLLDEDIKEIRAEIFTTAFSVAKSDSKVTKDEEAELLNIQKYLGLEDEEIEYDKKELARLRLLNEIQQGNMPVIPPVKNLIMQRDEKAYWIEPASLGEEKVIRRTYQGGSRGVSFRIMKGVSYRVGSSRGHIVSETGIVTTSVGELVITNKRIIFKGNNKSFATKLDNLLDLQIFTNGINYSENNKSKTRLIRFLEEGNNDIVGAIISYAINHYGVI